MAVVCERRVGRYSLLARARRRERLGKREKGRGGRATERRSENLEETRTRIESWNKTSREEQLEKRWKGVNGVVDLCICVYIRKGRGGREEGGEGKFICWRRAAERRSTLSSTILLFPAAPLHETFSPIGPLEFSCEMGNVGGRRCRPSSRCF